MKYDVVIPALMKFYSLDPHATSTLCGCIGVILPFLTAIVNVSLRCGNLPLAPKATVVAPQLEKASLDPNYRSVSNMSYRLFQVIQGR